MAREKGTVSFSANFEAQKSAPLDARMLADTKADLLLTATWTANDASVYAYKGMVVSVHADSTPANNGLYQLTTLPYTDAANWTKQGSGSTSAYTKITDWVTLTPYTINDIVADPSTLLLYRAVTDFTSAATITLDISNGDLEEVSGTILPVIDKTFLELKALKGASSLIPGRMYRMTDYRTSYLIGSSYGQGAINPLLFNAIDVNRFDPIVRGTEVYYDDYVEYNYEFDVEELLGAAYDGYGESLGGYSQGGTPITVLSDTTFSFPINLSISSNTFAISLSYLDNAFNQIDVNYTTVDEGTNFTVTKVGSDYVYAFPNDPELHFLDDSIGYILGLYINGNLTVLSGVTGTITKRHDLDRNIIRTYDYRSYKFRYHTLLASAYVYNPLTVYSVGSLVIATDNAYVCIKESVGNIVTNTTYWTVAFTGVSTTYCVWENNDDFTFDPAAYEDYWAFTLTAGGNLVYSMNADSYQSIYTPTEHQFRSGPDGNVIMSKTATMAMNDINFRGIGNFVLRGAPNTTILGDNNIFYIPVADYNTSPLYESRAGKVIIKAGTTILADDTFTIYDNADPTKQMQLSAGSISAGQTRTLTIPNESGTIALDKTALTKDPTGFDEPSLVVINYEPTTQAVTLSGAGWKAYWRGTEVTALANGWVSAGHPDVTGHRYFLYYNGSSFVWADNTFPGFTMLLIAVVNYGATNKYAVRECHGFMQWQVHQAEHSTIGCYRSSGGTIPSASYVLLSTTAGDRRPDIDQTTIWDEDCPTTLAALTSKLYTIYNLTGASVGAYTLAAGDIIPLLTNNPYYNSFTTPNWSQTLFPNNSVGSVWIYAMPVTSSTGSQSYRYLFVQPQWVTLATNGNAGNMTTARNTELLRNPSELNLGTLTTESPEMVAIARIVVQFTTNWSIGNAVNLTGTRYSQVGSPSGTYLSAVATNGGLSGDGTGLNPLINTLTTGLAGGQTIYGSTLTAENLSIRANFTDVITGQINFLDSKDASSTSAASVTMAGGLGVAKKGYFGDAIQVNGNVDIASGSFFTKNSVPIIDTTNTLAGDSDLYTASQKAVKYYIDIRDAQNVKLTGDQTISGIKTFNSSPIVPTPTTATQATPKEYVDSLLVGTFWDNIAVATTASINLSLDLENGDTIDTYTLVTGDRVLVKNQSSPAQNGIYVVPVSGAASRAVDADTAAEVNNKKCIILNGSQANKFFFTTSTVSNLGTDPINLAQLASSTYTAGTNIDVTGSAISTKANVVFTSTYIGSGTINANAALDVDSTTKAFMPPRMNTTQMNAISSPTAGMVVYNSTANLLYIYNGSVWAATGAGSTVISQSGVTYNATQAIGDIVILCDCTANAITINLPTAVGNTARFTVKKIAGAYGVTIDPATTETIDGFLTYPISTLNQSETIISNNANWFAL